MSCRSNYVPDGPFSPSSTLFSFLTCLRTLTHYGSIAPRGKHHDVMVDASTERGTWNGRRHDWRGLLWGALPLWRNVILFSGVFMFLLWRGHTIGGVWAWSTLLLGIESLAWPIVTMVHVRLTMNQPTDEDMGLILNAVLFGLFSSVFWISFAYGLFNGNHTCRGCH